MLWKAKTIVYIHNIEDRSGSEVRWCSDQDAGSREGGVYCIVHQFCFKRSVQCQDRGKMGGAVIKILVKWVVQKSNPESSGLCNGQDHGP